MILMTEKDYIYTNYITFFIQTQNPSNLLEILFRKLINLISWARQ